MKNKELQDFFSNEILKWYQENKRDLPWRKDSDPYKIWISEIMLQQTQVKTVIPYYTRFLDHFPTIETLSNAQIDDVLSLWSGLGYYKRARQLKETAEIIVKNYIGKFPSEQKELLSLPGIGPYTAGAILSISFNKNYPVLDGNVKRVLTRFFLIEDNIQLKSTEKQLWELVKELLPEGRASDFNQGIMELGALVCTPQYNSTICNPCPVKLECKAKALNKADFLPVNIKKKKSEEVNLICLILSSKNIIYVNKRSDKAKLLKGMWELPFIESKLSDEKSQLKECELFIKDQFEISGNINYLGKVKHHITYRKITAFVYNLEISETFEIKEDLSSWVQLDEALKLPHSSLLEKALELFKNRDSFLF